MSYVLTATAVTESNPFPNSIATSNGNPTYCGANTYTFVPTKTFLTVSGSTISVLTSNVADTGVHIVAVTVSLTNNPGVTSITQNLTITITCVVSTLIFVTPPAALTTLNFGIDSQPMDILF